MFDIFQYRFLGYMLMEFHRDKNMYILILALLTVASADEVLRVDDTSFFHGRTVSRPSSSSRIPLLQQDFTSHDGQEDINGNVVIKVQDTTFRHHPILSTTTSTVKPTVPITKNENRRNIEEEVEVDYWCQVDQTALESVIQEMFKIAFESVIDTSSTTTSTTSTTSCVVEESHAQCNFAESSSFNDAKYTCEKSFGQVIDFDIYITCDADITTTTTKYDFESAPLCVSRSCTTDDFLDMIHDTLVDDPCQFDFYPTKSIDSPRCQSQQRALNSHPGQPYALVEEYYVSKGVYPNECSTGTSLNWWPYSLNCDFSHSNLFDTAIDECRAADDGEVVYVDTKLDCLGKMETILQVPYCFSKGCETHGLVDSLKEGIEHDLESYYTCDTVFVGESLIQETVDDDLLLVDPPIFPVYSECYKDDNIFEVTTDLIYLTFYGFGELEPNDLPNECKVHDSYMALDCDFEKSSVFDEYVSVCTQAGGKIVTVHIEGDCKDESWMTTYSHVPLCLLGDCDVEQFKDRLLSDTTNRMNEYYGDDHNCDIIVVVLEDEGDNDNISAALLSQFQISAFLLGAILYSTMHVINA